MRETLGLAAIGCLVLARRCAIRRERSSADMAATALRRLVRTHAEDLAALRLTLKNYDALRSSGGRADALLLRTYTDSDGTKGKILILAITGSVSLNIAVPYSDIPKLVAQLLDRATPSHPRWSAPS